LSSYSQTKKELIKNPKIWLITGVAGFIGSNLLEALLQLGQTVIGIDNFSNGHVQNLTAVKNTAGKHWSNFTFHEADIRNLDDCLEGCKNVNYVLHQAALGSIPRSIANPILTNDSNINGFLNMLVASKDSKIKRFVYAASSSTYGDHPGLPKVEDIIGKPLSPYAITKYVNELYAEVFSSIYGMETIGLRYFNVFGPKQSPSGAYAAVIPKWINSLLSGVPCSINGDGSTSRDFCYIENVVQANILAATSTHANAVNQVYNIAYGGGTSLNELFAFLVKAIIDKGISVIEKNPIYQDFRTGDVLHSLADISKAQKYLDYNPSHNAQEGLKETVKWFIEN
jgi:UDP-N-acetylglucosamine/UDP-N-acetylgalactosamine 4-epimerase|tara:strand:- start:1512 stop:2531 length:1020 start_codon:yes stop_codon:yes gene_type:complete